METMESCEESLNKLAMTVNQTLVETGRYFRNSGSTQTQLKRSLPRANDEFHAALDNLSERIFLAKAVLERDFECIRAEEASHEIAIPPPPEPAPINQTSDTVKIKEENKETSPENRKHSPSQTNVAPAAKDHSENDIMGNIPLNVPPEPQAGSDPMNTITQNSDHDALNTFDSLLPGLESYANAGGVEDSGMMLQQTDSDGGNKDFGAAKGQAGQADVQMEDMPPSESNFDNMFVGAGDFGDGEGLLGNIEIGELDDAWFT